MLDHIPVSYTERLDKSTDTLYIAIRPGNHVRAMKGKTMLLREYLANEDLTQAQFASRIGVSRSTVSSWMRGLQAPRPEHVMRIRYITNHEVTADDLQFGLERNIDPKGSKQLELMTTAIELVLAGV